MCSRSCTQVFSEPTCGLKVSFVYVYKTRLLLHKATTLQCVCAFKRSIRSGELRRKPFPPQPIFGARSHRRKRNSFGLQVFTLSNIKTKNRKTERDKKVLTRWPLGTVRGCRHRACTKNYEKLKCSV